MAKNRYWMFRLATCAPLIAILVTPRLSFADPNEDEVVISREARAAIDLAQQFLASQQKSDGSFYGGNGKRAGIVAAGVLAWMVNGNLPGEGKYGRNVAKGVDYILSCAQPSGLLFKGQTGHVMYEHGLAAICLGEAWGQTQDKRIYDKLKKAIDLIVRCQNDKGGWRYQPRVADDDLSVTVIQLLALRAAKDAGMAVPKEVIELAVKYVESCRSRKDKDGFSGFGYKPHGGKKWSTTAAGVMSLLLCGEYKPSQVKDGLDYLMHVREKKEDKQWFVYAHYYAAMAMYQTGNQGKKYEKYWKKWYPSISKELIQSQVKKGRSRGRFTKSNMPIWGTGMCTLILGIPYRYLPIYQR